jgi:hypothetical protein
MVDIQTNLTHTKWVVWYHDPQDKNWTLNSYKKLYEFNDLEGFWDLYKEWNNVLPNIYDGMFFLMRKVNNSIIYPLWEDKHNKNGGFWSFKISKEQAEAIWLELSVFLVSESLCRSEENSSIINGISISPKKNFCIIKIWNNNKTKCDTAIINKFSDKINFDECMYKCHVDNISNDKLKSQKIRSVKHTFSKR